VLHANNLNVAKQLRDRFPHPYTREAAQAFLKATQSADPAPTSRLKSLAKRSAGSATYRGPTSSDTPPKSAIGSERRTGAAASSPRP
jgi:hypothetical protein